jgi:iron complex outermembrane receptor protein
MHPSRLATLAGLALGWPLAAPAQTAPISPGIESASTSLEAPVKQLGIVVIEGRTLPTSLPTQIPTTMEGVTREQIQQTVNATDSEDALRYFPSLLVRKRYIGDYNHAILSSRASGTGNSARSAVYADGILLSNYLGNGVGGLSFPPRWGLVTPEEIERVDVMYGPFSAAYPGNSVGAVVDYVTHMPTRFEAHAKVGTVVQPFDLYNTHETYRAWQASASLGNRAGGWAWWVNVNRTDSEGQPLTFATRTPASGTSGGTGTPVSGAVLDANNTGRPWWVLGTGTQYHSVQDHLKLKLAYDIDPTLRASYVLGVWKNVAQGRAVSFLRDASGQPVSTGRVVIDGSAYMLSGADFVNSDEQLLHAMHGLSVKRHAGGTFDWELAASLYDYRRDEKHQSTGTLADGHGTGWTTLALKGTWRPEGAEHVVDFGAQQERYTLRYRGTGTSTNNVEGDTQLRSLWAQDTWRLAADWKTVLGGRAEQWEARNGRTEFPAPALPLAHAPRRESFFSPKAALSWQALPETVLKASLGRAVRMPTVGELYGATSSTNAQYINDPHLRPERSWTAELSAERELDMGNARLTVFAENTRDALYSQTTFDGAANRNVTRVQNIGRIATTGLEAALATKDWLLKGLELSGSLTYADSRVKENAGFVAVPGDTIGKWQPNIPRWRATALASYRVDAQWTGTLGARYSGRQYRTLDNSDVNGFTYMGVSRFLVVDARVLYRIDRQWSAAFGIDNLNNDRYWNFHPYPQRSYSAELRFDL